MTIHPDRPGVDDFYAAAGPRLRAAIGSSWRGRTVTVTARSGLQVRVVLADWCLCGGDHVIDLYRDAFEQIKLGPGATVSW